MDPTGYPRPDVYAGGPYLKDKGWGIAIVVLASLSMCCGLGVAGIGGALGIAGASVAASEAGQEAANGGMASSGVGTVFGLAGGLAALFGVAMLVASVIQIVGGFGVMSGRRWGFVLTAILAGISILLNIPQIPHLIGIVWIAIHGVIAWYCYIRLSGKEGPTPV